jgi:hypothetical protein
MWRLLANPEPTRVIAFDAAPAERTIALPGGTPWSEASRSLTAATTSAGLVVKGRRNSARPARRLRQDVAALR